MYLCKFCCRTQTFCTCFYAEFKHKDELFITQKDINNKKKFIKLCNKYKLYKIYKNI